MMWVIGAVCVVAVIALVMGYRRLDRLEREERQRQWEEDIRRRLRETQKEPQQGGEWLYKVAEEEHRDG